MANQIIIEKKGYNETKEKKCPNTKMKIKQFGKAKKPQKRNN
jgi:hypothetical protein